MQIDYTKMFSTPDELADFCMLPHEEQIRLEIEFAATSSEFEMACDLSKKNQLASTPETIDS